MIELSNVYKNFQTNSQQIQVLEKVNFSIQNGEFVSLFGPNGCGKTTLLKIIAQLLEPDSGKIQVDKTSKLSFIFQDYAQTLFPWKTCLENIVFPLEHKTKNKEELHKIAKKFLSEFEIDLPLHQYPYQCSGGQKQLVVLARSLINQSDLLLLDEPFAALDYTTRLAMENKFLKIWEKMKITTVFVSHDIEEAVYLSDKVYVLSKRPTRIISEVKVELPRPRTSAELTSSEFYEIKKKILHDFLGEQR